MGDELKDKLAQIDGNIRDLREDKAAKSKAKEEAREAFAAIPEGEEDAAAYEAAKDAVKAEADIADQIVALETRYREVLKIVGDGESQKEASPSSDKGPAVSSGVWDSSHLFEDDSTRASLEHISGSKSRFGSLQLGQVSDRDMFAADVDLKDNARRGTYAGIATQLYRPLRVLDLFPIGTTDGNLVPYTQESGDLDGAAETAEGAEKPESPAIYTDADAPVRTIAAWMKLRKQGLADYSALQGIIDGRLRYIVQRRLETQALNGDGSGVNLTGVLNTPGIGTVAYSSAVPVTELVLSGITNVYLADGEADGIVMHPGDWFKALTEKADTAGVYMGGGPFGITPQVLWGIPAVPSASVAEGTCLVGDFQLGASILIREGVNVLLSDSDQDDFVTNRVTMLGEMRAALPVWRPSVFQDVSLA